MKILFVFYSFEGNCRELARSMAGKVGGDLAEIKPVAETVPARGFMKYLRGGKASLFKETPALQPLPVDVASYDLVVVGTPVWCWNMTPAVRSFLSGSDWRGRRVALFSMCRGGRGFALPAMRKIVEGKGGMVVSSDVFTDLRWGDAAKTRAAARAWVERTLAASAPAKAT